MRLVIVYTEQLVFGSMVHLIVICLLDLLIIGKIEIVMQ
jgi:hypothetical protein